MGTWAFLLAVIVFTLLGCAAGIVTGLVPGIHVNNVVCIFINLLVVYLQMPLLL